MKRFTCLDDDPAGTIKELAKEAIRIRNASVVEVITGSNRNLTIVVNGVNFLTVESPSRVTCDISLERIEGGCND